MIYDEIRGIDERGIIVDVKDATRRKKIPSQTLGENLLAPILREGRAVAETEDLQSIRRRVKKQLHHVHPTIRRLLNPHEYPVGLDIGLHERRDAMIHEARRTQLEQTQ